MKNNRKPSIRFRSAVENTPGIWEAFQPGLRGLGEHSNKVELGHTLSCEGSVNIDDTLAMLYPHDNRWDYCFCYKGEVFFVEVHSAHTGEVSTVIRKLRWLKNWLRQQAPLINSMKAESRHPFYWIQSKGFHISPTSPQFRQAIQENIKPLGKLILD